MTKRESASRPLNKQTGTIIHTGWGGALDRSEGTDLAADVDFPVPMFPSRDLRQVT